MKSEVIVTFEEATPLRINLDKTEPMTPEAARSWLDDQFVRLDCDPVRPTGKVLIADKVLVVAQAAGPAAFGDAQWAEDFGRCASAALGKPVVHVDVQGMTIGF